MKKMFYKILWCAFAFVLFCFPKAMAARQTEFPVKMMEKSHVNSYSSVVTQLDFYDFEYLPEKNMSRLYYNYKSTSNYVALVLECYDASGLSVGTVDFDPYKNYIEVPYLTAMAELMPKNPADDTGTYLHLKYVNVYAADGRVMGICDLQIPVYRAVGWYPEAEVHAADGRSMKISPFQVDAYAAVGWYTKEHSLLQSIKDLYGQYRNVGDHRAGMEMINEYLPGFRESTYANAMYALRTEAMDNWRAAINCPVAIGDYQITTGFMGARQAEIEFTNLYYKTVAQFKVRFTCYDSAGNAVYTYYDTYRADEADLEPAETDSFSWMIYGAYDALSIGDMAVTEVVFADGTVWQNN